MNLYPELRKEDWRTIVKITGMSIGTVENVIYGRRQTPKVKKAIEKFIQKRKELVEDLTCEFNPLI